MATSTQQQVIDLLARSLIDNGRLRKEVVRRATGIKKGRQSSAFKLFDDRLHQLALNMSVPDSMALAWVIEAAIIRVGDTE